MSTLTLRRRVKEKEKLIKRRNGQHTNECFRDHREVLWRRLCNARCPRQPGSQPSHQIGSVTERLLRVCVLSFHTNASCRYTPSHLKHAIFSTQFTLSTPRRELLYELHVTRFTTNLTNTLCRLAVASISDYTLHNRNS